MQLLGALAPQLLSGVGTFLGDVIGGAAEGEDFGESALRGVGHAFGAKGDVVPKKGAILDKLLSDISFDTITSMLPKNLRSFYETSIAEGFEGEDLDITELKEALKTSGIPSNKLSLANKEVRKVITEWVKSRLLDPDNIKSYKEDYPDLLEEYNKFKGIKQEAVEMRRDNPADLMNATSSTRGRKPVTKVTKDVSKLIMSPDSSGNTPKVREFIDTYKSVETVPKKRKVAKTKPKAKKAKQAKQVETAPKKKTKKTKKKSKTKKQEQVGVINV